MHIRMSNIYLFTCIYSIAWSLKLSHMDGYQKVFTCSSLYASSCHSTSVLSACVPFSEPYRLCCSTQEHNNLPCSCISYLPSFTLYILNVIELPNAINLTIYLSWAVGAKPLKLFALPIRVGQYVTGYLRKPGEGNLWYPGCRTGLCSGITGSNPPHAQ